MYDYTCSSCGHGDGMHSGSCAFDDFQQSNYKIQEWAGRLDALYSSGTRHDFSIEDLKKIIDEMYEY